MKKYKILSPEVAGGLGEKTIMDTTVHPPIVKFLNYEFFGWLGDDILESFPCFIVTQRLKDKIEQNKLTGVLFDNVIITKSEEFINLHGDIDLPKFYWLKITGFRDTDDFKISDKFNLLISHEAVKVLSEFKISNYHIFEDYLE